MNLRRIPALFLAVALQALPVVRVAQSIQVSAPSMIVIVLRFASAVAGMFGSVHAVSGASTTLNSPTTARATNGVAFSYRITTGPQVANRFAAAPLPAGLTVSATTGRILGAPTQTGSFTVLLTASDSGQPGRTVTANLALTVVAGGGGVTAPTITTQPTSQTVTAGANVALTVSGSGTAALTYQWLKSGMNIPGATRSTLSFTPVSLSDAGAYTVIVSNAGGSVTSLSAVLTVHPAAVAPTLTTQPISQSVILGGEVVFTVAATGTAILTYQWSMDGVSLPGATSPTLALTDVTLGDAGEYSVVVVNGVGIAISTTATLTVHVPPTFTTQPRSALALTGGTLSLTATAAGTAPLAYQWQKGGVDLAGETSSTLSLTAVTTNDNGSYGLRVSNVAGSSNSVRALVVVRPPPQPPTVLTQPLTQMKFVGDAVDLVVGVTGTAPFAYQWTHAGTNLVGQTSATLSFPSISLLQAGRYAVGVSNSVGTSSSRPAFLIVRAAPSVPLAERLASANQAPVAVAEVQGQALLGTNYSRFVILSPGQGQVGVVFDGSFSTDADHDSLSYLWETLTSVDSQQVFSQSAISTNTLGEGSFSIRLTVSDATYHSPTALSLSVVSALTFCQALLADLGNLAARAELTKVTDALRNSDIDLALFGLNLALGSLDAALNQGLVSEERHAARSEGVRRLIQALQFGR